MDCQLNLVPLSCDRTGVGFTAHPLSIESNRLHLLKGHTKHFPTIEGQQYFYVKIQGCDGCCETSKVISIEEDTLLLDRTIGAKCACIQSHATVTYDWDNIHVVTDVAKSIGINVESPLKYDPCTRTLSVDCKELFAKDCGGCGCGEGTQNTTAIANRSVGTVSNSVFNYIELGTNAYIYGTPNTDVMLEINDLVLGPYTTGVDGVVAIDKPATKGKNLVVMTVNDDVVGLGRTG